MSRVILSLVVLCVVGGLTALPALAADLKPALPKSSEFNDGPQGGGAELGIKERVPSSGEFNSGPEGVGGTELNGGGGDGGDGGDGAASPPPGWGDLPAERTPESP